MPQKTFFYAVCRRTLLICNVIQYSSEITTAQEERNHTRSPQYSSYSVRLSTFARFRVTDGVDVHMIAAAGFYYTGYMDIVRCYACDGGLKQWAPGDDPWDEHYRWFPNCFYLKVSNYNPTRRKNKPEYSSRRSEEKPVIVVREAPALEVVARRQNELTIEKQKQKKVVAEPDLNTPAALAVLDFGYSRKAVKMAIQELRIKGQTRLTAHGILQVLISFEDKGIKLPSDDDK